MGAVHHVALDLGTTCLRAVSLKGTRGKLQVQEAIQIARTGEDYPIAEAVSRLQAARAPVRSTVLGVPGRLATLRYNLVPPVPDWRLGMIMKYETQEIAEKSGEPLSCAYRKLELPESNSTDQVVLVGLGKDGLIQPLIDALQAAGGRPSLAVPNALGLYHAYVQTQASPPRETVLLADIGAVETHVVLVTDGRLVFARSVQFGGRQADEAIASAVGVRVEQAVRFKEALETGKVPAQVVDGVHTALRSAYGQLNTILQSSVTFCRAQTKISELPIESVLLAGGMARAPGLTTFLEGTFRVPVKIFRPNLGGQALPGAPEEWVTAIGLAAAAADTDGLNLDLLPAPARAQREFRERTRFLYGAAGMLVLALTITLVLAAVARGSAGTKSAEVQSWQRRVQGFQQERQTASVENARIEEQIARLQAELEINAFSTRLLDKLQDCMPGGISLTRLRTARSVLGTQQYLQVELVGISDNSERNAIQHLSEFQRALESLPFVRRVELQPPVLDGGVYRFTMSASPDAEVPAETGVRGPMLPGRGRP